MRHRGLRAAVAIAACLAALEGRGEAETATFDDFTVPTGEFTLPALVEYRGLRWSGIKVVHGAHEFLNRFAGCGYRTGIVSGGHAAIVANRFRKKAEITSARGAPFDFNGVHFTAAWRNGLNVRLEGLRGGARLYSKTVAVDMDRPTLFTFDFLGIDTLRISSSGGVDTGICEGEVCRPGPEVVMDDFLFSFAAEPEAKTPPPPHIEQAPARRPPQVQAAVRKPPGAALAAEPAGAACPAGHYHGVQVGAFRSSTNAAGFRDRMSAEYGLARVHVKGHKSPLLYRVVVGCTDQSGPARDLLRRLRGDGVQGFVVRASETDVVDQP